MACKHFFVKRCNIINYPLTRWQCHQSVQNGRLFYKVWHINIESSDTHVTDLISLPRRKSKKKNPVSREFQQKKLIITTCRKTPRNNKILGQQLVRSDMCHRYSGLLRHGVAFCIWECTGFQRDEKGRFWW